MIGRIWTRIKHTSWSAHLLRANDRYQNRLGNQLAGGITYFSVLTLIPVLMFAFSVLGFTLTVVRRDWLIQLKDLAVRWVGAVAGGQRAVSLIDDALSNWRSLGLIALISAAYAGSGWMGNLRGAVRAQWRPDFDWSPPGRNFLVERLINLVYFLILMVMVTIGFVVSIMGGQVGQWLIRVIHLNESVSAPTLRAGAFTLSVLTGFVLFYFLYTVMPQYEAPTGALLKGSAIASVLFALLQFLTTRLIAEFSRSFSAIVFGNIIVVMIFFNLFARLTLFMAAWIATAYQPAMPRKYNETDEMLRGREGIVTVKGHWEAADLDKERIDARKLRALAPPPGGREANDVDDEEDLEEVQQDGRTLLRRKSQVPYRRQRNL